MKCILSLVAENPSSAVCKLVTFSFAFLQAERASRFIDSRGHALKQYKQLPACATSEYRNSSSYSDFLSAHTLSRVNRCCSSRPVGYNSVDKLLHNCIS